MRHFAAFVHLAERAQQPEFSTAGFFEIPTGTRGAVYRIRRMIPWRLTGEARSFDDPAGWCAAASRHRLFAHRGERMQLNHRGEWYRKHFRSTSGRSFFAHPEAIRRAYMSTAVCLLNTSGAISRGGGCHRCHRLAGLTMSFGMGRTNSDQSVLSAWKGAGCARLHLLVAYTATGWLVAHDRMHIDPNWRKTWCGRWTFVSHDKQRLKHRHRWCASTHMRNERWWLPEWQSLNCAPLTVLRRRR